MPELTVREASEAYQGAMRNIAPAGRGVCETCRTFVDPAYVQCYPCSRQPDWLDAVVPITYSEHLGQMHTALRNYKDGVGPVQWFAAPRLAGILWRFLDSHEPCIEAAAGAFDGFQMVTAVPSSSPDRDEQRGNLRWMVEVIGPVAGRFQRTLKPTGQVPAGREYNEGRYTAMGDVAHANILLVDDTWTRGGHAQSAAYALRQAGARRIALVVIGRHIHRTWELNPGETNAHRLDALPRRFRWDTCAVHDPAVPI